MLRCTFCDVSQFVFKQQQSAADEEEADWRVAGADPGGSLGSYEPLPSQRQNFFEAVLVGRGLNLVNHLE